MSNDKDARLIRLHKKERLFKKVDECQQLANQLFENREALEKLEQKQVEKPAIHPKV